MRPETETEVRVAWSDLEDVVATLFEARGVSREHSRLVAHHLVRADARGIHSHGVIRLNFYLPKLDAGNMSTAIELTTEIDTPSFNLVSANNGIGQVVATEIMNRTIGMAQKTGLGATLVRHSNHFGVAQMYTLQAADRGLIGIVLSNASPAIAPTGGAEKLLGNNPWSVAVPSSGDFPVVVDMANTVVARGKILTAIEENRQIPSDWALDSEGRPTTDPNEAIKGIIQPMGGHKGYAITLAVDLLTGVLGGGGWMDDVHYPGTPDKVGNVSHLFLVIDPHLVAPENYEERVLDAVRKIKGVKKAPGVDEVFVPGETEARREKESKETGVPLSTEILSIVTRHATEAGVACPWVDA